MGILRQTYVALWSLISLSSVNVPESKIVHVSLTMIGSINVDEIGVP